MNWLLSIGLVVCLGPAVGVILMHDRELSRQEREPRRYGDAPVFDF